MKINDTTALALNIILTSPNRHCYGLDIVKKSEGKIKKSSVYVLLLRMEDKGLIEAVAKKGNLKLYEATGLGQESLDEYISKLHTFKGASYATDYN